MPSRQKCIFLMDFRGSPNICIFSLYSRHQFCFHQCPALLTFLLLHRRLDSVYVRVRALTRAPTQCVCV